MGIADYNSLGLRHESMWTFHLYLCLGWSSNLGSSGLMVILGKNRTLNYFHCTIPQLPFRNQNESHPFPQSLFPSSLKAQVWGFGYSLPQRLRTIACQLSFISSAPEGPSVLHLCHGPSCRAHTESRRTSMFTEVIVLADRCCS